MYPVIGELPVEEGALHETVASETATTTVGFSGVPGVLGTEVGEKDATAEVPTELFA